MPYNKKKNSFVLYTAISGGFDDLIEHTYISSNFDYVCFTDTPVENPGNWEIRHLEDRGLGNNRNAKYYKIFPNEIFPEYEYSIWIDANIDVLNNDLEERIFELIEGNKMLSANIHFERSCIYDEANVCIANSIDETDVIKKQVDKYLKEGFPKNYGLFEMNIIFRNHQNNSIVKLMHHWWEIINQFSHRDQLSFMYSLWKSRLKCEQMFPVTHRNMENSFRFMPHNKKINSVIFVDTGHGFRAEELFVELVLIKTDQDCMIKFYITSQHHIHSIRFDPVENQPCCLKINKITIKQDGIEKHHDFSEIQAKIKSNGALKPDGWIVFDTIDPQVILPFSGKIESIGITGRIELLSVDQVIANKEQAIREKDEQVLVKDQTIARLEQNLLEKDRVLHHKDQTISQINRQVLEKDQAIARLNQELLDKEQDIHKKDEQIGYLYNSWSYKIGRYITRPAAFGVSLFKSNTG